MMLSTDVVVIGAGPAGASLACRLAHGGVAVLLVDKDAFPREKVCGDGLTPRCVDLLREIGVSDLPRSIPVGGIRVWDLGDGSVMEAALGATPRGTREGLVVPRLVLDQGICERAVDAGAVFWPRTTVIGLVRRGGSIRGVCAIREGREVTIEARVTVVAEGSAGRLGAELRGPDRFRSDVGYAVRQYARGVTIEPFFEVFFPVTGNHGDLAGYGWVFPSDGCINLGAGFFYGDSSAQKVNVRRVYESFLTRLRRTMPRFAAVEPTSALIGAPLRIGLEPESCHGDGWLLVGDAAGVINPFTGEGIGYALESASAAAEAIRATLSSHASLGVYATALRERYPRHVSLRGHLPNLFGFVERNFASTLSGRIARLGDRSRAPGAIPRALRHLVSDRAQTVDRLGVPGTLSEASESVSTFSREVMARLLARLADLEPLAAESIRYVVTSSSALIGLPSALVHTVTAACGSAGDAQRAMTLAEATEAFAIAHLLLTEVRPGHDTRSYRHTNALALLWGDLLLGQALGRLFELPADVGQSVLSGEREAFHGSLARSRLIVASMHERAAPHARDCVPLCSAGGAAAASLVGVPAGTAEWFGDWAEHVATAHRALGDAVGRSFGDEALGVDPTPTASAAERVRLLDTAGKALDAARERLAALPTGIRSAGPLNTLITATQNRRALVLARLSEGEAGTWAPCRAAGRS